MNLCINSSFLFDYIVYILLSLSSSLGDDFYFLGNQQFGNTKIINPKTGHEVELSAIINSVQNEAIALDKGKFWPLTYYTPFKDKALYPGFIDLSFEEVRFGYLEAQKSNTLEQYVSIEINLGQN